MILSIDVGIQNLALCLLDADGIYLWTVLDLTDGAGSAKQVDLVSIARSLRRQLDALISSDILADISVVVVENQIAPLATRMKTVQGMLLQYFVDRVPVSHHDVPSPAVVFVSSRNKLALLHLPPACVGDHGVPKAKTASTYAQRKRRSVQLCRSLLAGCAPLTLWQSHFCKSSKKDDLADSFLQGLHYLQVVLLKQPVWRITGNERTFLRTYELNTLATI